MNIYDEGLELFYQKRFDEAIKKFFQDTEHNDRFLQIANCYLCKKDYDKALEYVEKCNMKYPAVIDYTIIKGVIQSALGNKDIDSNILSSMLHKYKIRTILLLNKLAKRVLLFFIFILWIIISLAKYQIIEVSKHRWQQVTNRHNPQYGIVAEMYVLDNELICLGYSKEALKDLNSLLQRKLKGYIGMAVF